MAPDEERERLSKEADRLAYAAVTIAFADREDRMWMAAGAGYGDIDPYLRGLVIGRLAGLVRGLLGRIFEGSGVDPAEGWRNLLLRLEADPGE